MQKYPPKKGLISIADWCIGHKSYAVVSRLHFSAVIRDGPSTQQPPPGNRAVSHNHTHLERQTPVSSLRRAMCCGQVQCWTSPSSKKSFGLPGGFAGLRTSTCGEIWEMQQIFYGELDGGRDNKGSVGRPVTWCCGCELRPRSVLGLETNVKVTHVRVCFLLCGAIGSSTADTSWGEVPSVQQN